MVWKGCGAGRAGRADFKATLRLSRAMKEFIVVVVSCVHTNVKMHQTVFQVCAVHCSLITRENYQRPVEDGHLTLEPQAAAPLCPPLSLDAQVPGLDSHTPVLLSVKMIRKLSVLICQLLHINIITNYGLGKGKNSGKENFLSVIWTPWHSKHLLVLDSLSDFPLVTLNFSVLSKFFTQP